MEIKRPYEKPVGDFWEPDLENGELSGKDTPEQGFDTIGL